MEEDICLNNNIPFIAIWGNGYFTKNEIITNQKNIRRSELIIMEDL
jgi:hypothetical protein